MPAAMLDVDSEFEFPTELLMLPPALIGISGLDTLNNAVHKMVWDALSNSRAQDRPPVHFQLLSPAHEFPRPKMKKTLYDMHIPKGILKRSWMRKHLSLVPAVVVVFYDLDWDDPQWEEKKLECTSRVQSIRIALEGRGSRVCVVLIQSNSPLPTGEDLFAAERASSLFQAAELSNKSLFILPHTENLYGFTARLEKAFFELASSYYQHKIKGVKSHKEHLNKKTHQYLFVRHQFKMGFFSELKQDLFTAYNHYSESYSQLLEVRVSDTNEMEVKTVAGFVAYKLCRLNFSLSRARDAISQFRAHVEHYRHQTGPPSLLFQHHAWLAKQFSMFANLFDEMVSQGCPAVQIQHPGYYYQLAAKQATERRTVAIHLCAGAATYPNPDPLEGKDRLEFFGQRPWRACKLSAEPLDPDKERQGFAALQWIEKNRVDHSGLIIGLLGSAISQFKNYRCPRMRRHLVVQMAEEYQSSKEYGKALTLLCHMLWDYRGEGWYKILDSLLSRALAAAYITASLPEYAALTFEVASRSPNSPQASKALDNLIALTKGEVPEREPGLKEDEIREALEAWRRQGESESLTVDTAALCSAIDIKATILSAAHNDIHISIVIKCSLPKAIEFSALIICVSNATGTSDHTVATGLKFDRCGQIRSFECHIKPTPQDIGKLVQVSSILLRLGESGKGRPVYLKFTGQGSEASIPYQELLNFRRMSHEEWGFTSTKAVLSRAVPRRPARLGLVFDHAAPAVMCEWFPVEIKIISQEQEDILHTTLTMGLNDDSSIEQATEFCEKLDGGLVSLPLSIPLGKIVAGGEVSKSFLMKANTPAARHLDIKVSYQVCGGDTCLKESGLTVDTVPPFSFATSYLNLRLEEAASSVRTHRPFLLQTKLDCLSPWPLRITSTKFKLGKDIEFEGEYTCVLQDTILKKGESASCLVCLITKVPSDNPIDVATFIISWNRLDNKESFITDTSVPLTPLPKVTESLIKVEMEAPSQGSVRTLMPVTYTITNLTTKLFTLQLTMEPSDAFMFSGHKQLSVHVLPEAQRQLHYNLYPLLGGLVRLPRLGLASQVDSLPQAAVHHALDALPASAYVLPQKKEWKGPESAQILMLSSLPQNTETRDTKSTVS